MRTQHTVHVYGDNVNTDVIFPGKYTYTLKTSEEIAAHALEDLDAGFVARVQPDDVVVAGVNWGMGSSREQAVTCLALNSVKIIVAASFGGLYMRNCINQGVYPIVCAGLSMAVKTGDTLVLDREAGVIEAAGQVWPIPSVSASVAAMLKAGGLLAMLQTRFKAPSDS